MRKSGLALLGASPLFLCLVGVNVPESEFKTVFHLESRFPAGSPLRLFLRPVPVSAMPQPEAAIIPVHNSMEKVSPVRGLST